jgi:DNA-binding IclR family transcriptional regulator
MSRDIPVQSVRKALDLLNLLVFEDPGREGLALGDLAGRLQFPAATAHNLLKTLCACGYAAQMGAGRYRVGPRCLDVGRFNRLLNETIATMIRARMEALGRALNETVTFAVLADGRRLLLWTTEPGQLIRIDAATLETRRLFTVPTGRILAAHASLGELERLLARHGLPSEAEWPKTTTLPALKRALAEIRARGHEVMIRSDLSAFAVPVLDAAGGLAGSLGCFSPSFRCLASQHATVVAALKHAALAIAAAL